MPLKTWTAGDVVNASDLNTTIEDAIKNVIYDLDAGETIDGTSDPVPVYVKGDDGELYKTDATKTDGNEETTAFAGVILNSTSNGNEARLQTGGQVEFSTPFTLSVPSVRKDQDFEMAVTANFFTMDAVSTKRFSCGFKTGHKVSTIEQVVWDLGGGSPSGITGFVDIHAMDANGKPTGASLGTSSTETLNLSPPFTFTFGTPVPVEPDTEYCVVLQLATYSSGSIIPRGPTTATPQGDYTWIGKPTTVTHSSTDSGSSWSTSTGAKMASIAIYSGDDEHRFGDDVYLSATAGEFTLDLPSVSGNVIKKVGKLLTATDILLEPRTKELLGETDKISCAGGGTVDLRPRLIFHAPSKAVEAVIVFEHNGEEHSQSIIKGETLSIATNTTQTITAAWVNGCIRITHSNNSGAIEARIRFYT